MSEGGGALRELLAVFGIDVDDKALGQAHEKLKGFAAVARETAGLVAEAFAIREIKEFIGEQIELGAQLKITAERLGMDTNELQAFQLAAGEAGVSTDAMTTGLRFLNRNIAQAIEGSADTSKVFRDMGVQIKDANGHARDAGDVMQDVADHLSEMEDQSKKTRVAMQLFGRGGAELIPLLNRGGEAFEEARKSMQELGGGMSKEFVEAAHEAEAANVRLKFSMTGLKSEVALAVIPVVNKVVEWLTNVVVVTKEFTKETNVLQTALAALSFIAGLKLAASLGGLAKTLGLIRPTVLETIAAFAEFALPLLAVGALYLVFDDLYTLMRGGKSVIGETIDELFGLGEGAQFGKDLNDTLGVMPDLLKNVGSIVWNVLVGALESAYDIVKGIVRILGDIVTGDFASVSGDFDKSLKEIGDDSTKRFDKIVEAGEGVGDDFTLNAKGLRDKKARQAYIAALPPGQDPDHFSGPLPGDRGSVPAPAGPITKDDISRRQYAEALAKLQRDAIPEALRRPTTGPGSVFLPPSAVAPAAAAGASAGGVPGVVIQQTNKYETTVTTGSDKPKDVGDAVSGALATSQQKANANAKTALGRR